MRELTERSWSTEYTTATKSEDTESASTSASTFNARRTARITEDFKAILSFVTQQQHRQRQSCTWQARFFLFWPYLLQQCCSWRDRAWRNSEQAAATTETEEHVSWARAARTTRMVPARRVATAADTTNSPETRGATATATKSSPPPPTQLHGLSREVQTEDETDETSRSPAPTTAAGQSSPAAATFETTDRGQLTRSKPRKRRRSSTPAENTATSPPQHEHPLVVCVVGGHLRSTKPPPAGLCDYMVFEHVRVAKDSEDFVAASNQLALDNYMKMAAGSASPHFLLSLSADSEFDESLEVRDRAANIVERYRAQNVRGYGFARYQVASAGIETGKLWKHHEMLLNLRQWSTEPLVVFLGLLVYHHPSYPDAYVTGLVSEVAASLSFLILVAHYSAPPSVAPKRCEVELISSWTRDAFNDRRLMSVEEAASVLNTSRLERDIHLPLLLSQSMAVVEYKVEKDSNTKQPRVNKLKCYNCSLQPFHTVCRSSSSFLSGGRSKTTFSHYDDDPVNGIWRTYKTAVDMVNEIQSVEYALDPSVARTAGWAFYDLDLEDYHGDCASYWSPSSGDSDGNESVAYYRLKHAVRQVMALRAARSSHPDSGSGSSSA
ncbi:uncharacterized protein LOC144099489 isoform X3 [Amblyomma americanum]